MKNIQVTKQNSAHGTADYCRARSKISGHLGAWKDISYSSMLIFMLFLFPRPVTG